MVQHNKLNIMQPAQLCSVSAVQIGNKTEQIGTMRIDFKGFSANSSGPKPDALPDCATLRTLYNQWLGFVFVSLPFRSAQFPAQFQPETTHRRNT